ncbi:MAG: hypothetical protein R3B09_10650 [Nannocystaceae bacterium]
MSIHLRRLLVASLAGVAAFALADGCIRDNLDHCNYKNVGFCGETYPDRPHCSVCEGEYDGCVQSAPPSECEVDSMGSATATAAETDSTTEASEGSATTSSATDDATTEPTTTGEATTASTATTEMSSTSSTTEGTTTSTTTEGTTTSTTTEMTTSTTAEPICGDGHMDPGEVCDGDDLGGQTCAKNPMWGGGDLTCAADCASLDYTACCLGAGMKCDQLNDKCCPGLKCKSDGLLSTICKSI